GERERQCGGQPARNHQPAKGAEDRKVNQRQEGRLEESRRRGGRWHWQVYDSRMSAMPATASFGERARLWGVAIRAFSFPASIVPVLLGSAYAWYEARVAGAAQFHWGMFVLAMLAGMLYHVGVN